MVMSDHGFHSFRREVNLNTWLVQNGYMVVPRPGGQREEPGRPVRPRPVLGGRRLVARRGPTRWAWARSTSTCRAARRRASSPRARSTRRSRTRSRTKLAAAHGSRRPASAVFARRLPPRRHLQGRVPAERARPAGRLQRRLPRGLAGHPGRDPPRGGREQQPKWSGDHCATATEISGGVFFSNRKIATDEPSIMDLSPTILKLLEVPAARRPGRQAPHVRRAAILRPAARGLAAAAAAAQAAVSARARRRRAPGEASPAPRRRDSPTDERLAQGAGAPGGARARARRGCAARRRACSARWSGSSWRCGFAARSCARPSSCCSAPSAELDATLRGSRRAREEPRRGPARCSRPTRAPSTSWASCRYLRLLLSVDRPSDFFRGYRFVTHPRPPRQRSGSRPSAPTSQALRRSATELEQRTAGGARPARPSSSSARRDLDARPRSARRSC